MPVTKEASGRRSVELEFELPGTPEQVWQAIATGPGISSWFVPSEVEERAGGAVVFHLGPDMDSAGRVTAWEPPRRFVYEEAGWSGEAPPLASEFIVEARSGGTCVVRLVHSLFTSSDEWDDQLDSMEKGWPPYFEVLRLYLAHFTGQRAASIRSMGNHPTSEAAAWAALTQELGLAGAAVGERRNASVHGAPSLAGIVERIDQNAHHCELMLRLEQPARGVALFGTGTWGGQVLVALSLYFYGDEAATVAAREAPLWQAWMKQHFPPAGEASKDG